MHEIFKIQSVNTAFFPQRKKKVKMPFIALQSHIKTNFVLRRKFGENQSVSEIFKSISFKNNLAAMPYAREQIIRTLYSKTYPNSLKASIYIVYNKSFVK